MKLVYWLVVVAFFTASCDKILNVNLGGSLRLCQIVMIVVCLAAAARVIQTGTVLWPRGSNSLTMWMVIQAAFIPLSGVMSIGLTFYVLLLFTVVSVLALVQLYGMSDHIESLMRMYLLSFVFIACVGLVQFALPLMGLPSFMVQQWIVHGRLARISAFSYEPSFYITYLTMGWIMLIELRHSRARITQGSLWRIATILVTASLFLSTSKTAWVFMLLEGALRLAPPLWRSLRSFLADIRRGRIVVRIPGRTLLRNGLILIVVAIAGAAILARFISNPAIFLSGTGLASQPAHSVNTRLDVFHQTLEAYEQHPFIGRSIGGVSIYIASRQGIEVTTMEMVRSFWGFPVLLDVLVASGLFGFIPFLVFLYANTIRPLRLARRLWPDERARWVRALARAMIFEWLILLVDQNLLRTYLWFQISMVAVVAYHLEFAPAPIALPARRPDQATFGEPAAAL
jgi:O-antigen ligase